MYLVAYSNYPFTAADIRRDIGLKSAAFDGAIECAIVRAASVSGKPIRTETWAIADGVKPVGKPTEIGSDLYQFPANITDRRWFRDHTFAPDTRAVEAVRRLVVDWCLRQDDIALAMGAEARRAMCAPVALQAVA